VQYNAFRAFAQEGLQAVGEQYTESSVYERWLVFEHAQRLRAAWEEGNTAAARHSQRDILRAILANTSFAYTLVPLAVVLVVLCTSWVQGGVHGAVRWVTWALLHVDVLDAPSTWALTALGWMTALCVAYIAIVCVLLSIPSLLRNLATVCCAASVCGMDASAAVLPLYNAAADAQREITALQEQGNVHCAHAVMRGIYMVTGADVPTDMRLHSVMKRTMDVWVQLMGGGNAQKVRVAATYACCVFQGLQLPAAQARMYEALQGMQLRKGEGRLSLFEVGALIIMDISHIVFRSTEPVEDSEEAQVERPALTSECTQADVDIFSQWAAQPSAPHTDALSTDVFKATEQQEQQPVDAKVQPAAGSTEAVDAAGAERAPASVPTVRTELAVGISAEVAVPLENETPVQGTTATEDAGPSLAVPSEAEGPEDAMLPSKRRNKSSRRRAQRSGM